MLQGTVLPGPAPKAAEVAANAGSNSATAALGAEDIGNETPTFGAVLQEKLGNEGAQPGGETAPAVPVDPQSAQPIAVDPALQALFAALQSAAVVPAAATLQASNDVTLNTEVQTKYEGAVDPLAENTPRPEGGASSQDLIAKEEKSTDAKSQFGADRQIAQFSETLLKKGFDSLELKAVSELKGQELAVAKDGMSARAPSELPTQASPVQTPASAVVRELRAETPAPSVRVSVTPEVSHPRWGSSFADRVTWITQTAQPTAELQLNPPQLGPVEVRVSVDSEQQTSLSFFSPHAAVREAIQAAIPRLTEAFNASGLSLGNVFVGAESQQQQQGQRDNAFARRESDMIKGESEPRIAQVSWLRNGALGSIDLFA